MSPTIYTDVSKLPKRQKHDFYATPRPFCNFVLNKLRGHIHFPVGNILDPGAGNGVWGQAARSVFPKARIFGCDIRDIPKPAQYDSWHSGMDFTEAGYEGTKFDLIVGNPPFSLMYEFINNGFKHMDDWGIMAFLLPLTFVESATRYRSYFAVGKKRPMMVWISSNRVNFDGLGSSNPNAYAMVIWNNQNFYSGTQMDWLLWR